MQPSKEKSLALLRRSLERVSALGNLEKYLPDHEKWERSARRAIQSIFGDESQQLKDFDAALKPYSSEGKMYAVSKADAFRRVSPMVTTVLEGLIEEVEDYWEHASSDTVQTLTPASVPPTDKNIFIIHGHDVGAKEQLARFLSKLGLNPIILHEHASQGTTVIEKFEQFAAVSYAVALLTPDDVGASNAERKRLRSRPRQNVLFEFGYFIGKLGRRYVCGLVKGDLEIPSDYAGVLYIKFDTAGAWKMEVIRELRAAGLQIDANTAL